MHHELLDPALRFSAHVVHGAGRGRKLKIPTINVALGDAPPSLMHGVYACRIVLDDRQYMGAMHYGPRPVFADSESLEVHVLDAALTAVPEEVTLEVVARLRDVQNFPDAQSLKNAIADDIRSVRAILRKP